MRLFAEFDNFRKRTAKERIELFGTASKDIMTSLLPILDNFERSFKVNIPKEDDGVLLIYNQLKTELEKKGLKEIENPIGKVLDTDFHEAITNIPTEKNIPYVWTDRFDLLQWMGVTNAVDHVLACDSVSQHFANALKKPATVVIGATFPENISYPNNPNFKIFDLGKDKRIYSPIRIVHEPAYDLNNEGLMLMEEAKRNEIVNYVKEELNKNE